MSKTIKFIEKLEEEREKRMQEFRLYHDRNSYIHAFRGENLDFGETSNLPSMYRKSYDLNALIEAIEDSQISKHDDDFLKLIDSQHNVAISNMLDISYNCLVSLFFACYHERESDNTGSGYFFEFIFPKSFIASKQLINEDIRLVRSKSDRFRELRISNFRVIGHNNINSRIVSQSGGFLYFYSDDYPMIPKHFYNKIEIPKEDKKIIIKELDQYFNINASTLFPEANNQASKIHKMLENKSNRYITNEFDLVIEELEISKINYYYEVIENMKNFTKDKQVRILENRKILRHYNENVFNINKILNKKELMKFEDAEEESCITNELNVRLEKIKEECEDFIILCELEREKNVIKEQN